LKIVFVQAGLGAGGAEKIVNLLASHYASKGHEVSVLALSGVPGDSFFDYDPAITIETFLQNGERNSGLAARLANIRWLRKRFHETKPDLVVSFLTRVNLFASIAARSCGIPIVVSERNNPGIQHGKRPWRFANRITGLLADRMVMQTRQAAEFLTPLARRKAVVIPNPCTNRGSAGIPAQDPPAFVATGRLDRQKGFDLLLQAFVAVAQQVPDATLTIFGEGPEQQELSSLIDRLGLTGRARLSGRTRRPGDWINHGNLFVLSSRFEGFPNVLVEAMAAGMAVVAFDCAWGPAELVTHSETGMLVEVENVDQLARAMTELASDPDLRARISAAAPHAVDHLSLPRILAQWDQVIEAYEPFPDGLK
jgi:glycosyltransferase involved in cell wall biosynthesis